MSDYTTREGATEPIVVVLKQKSAAGVISVFNLTGLTEVVLHLKNKDGTASSFSTIANPTKLAITNAAAGEVTFTPAASDLTNAGERYKGFFRVTLASGSYADFPNGSEFEIYVRQNF